MRTGELRYLTENMPDEAVARDALWAYVGAHYDAFARKQNARGMGNMATILKGACEVGAHGDAEAFFQQKMGAALGARRRIDHTEEQIDRCVALRQNAGADISAALGTAK
jgi:hypothetical protein